MTRARLAADKAYRAQISEWEVIDPSFMDSGTFNATLDTKYLADCTSSMHVTLPTATPGSFMSIGDYNNTIDGTITLTISSSQRIDTSLDDIVIASAGDAVYLEYINEFIGWKSITTSGGSGGGGNRPWQIITDPTVDLVSTNRYLFELTRDVTATLPIAMPGDYVTLADYNNTIGNNTVTITSTQNIENGTADIEMVRAGDVFELEYVNDTFGWKRIVPVDTTVPQITVSATQPLNPLVGDIWIEL